MQPHERPTHTASAASHAAPGCTAAIDARRASALTANAPTLAPFDNAAQPRANKQARSTRNRHSPTHQRRLLATAMAPPSSAFVPTIPATRPRAQLSTASTRFAASTPVASTRVAPLQPARVVTPVVAPLPARAPTQTPAPSPPAASRGPCRIALWLHADLRVEDNAALVAAVEAVAASPGGALVPIMLEMPGTAASPAATALRADAARELRAALEARGSGLVSLRGGPDAFLRVCENLKLDAVYYNRAVLSTDVVAQDRLAKRAIDAGLHVRAFWGNVLDEPTDADLAKESRTTLNAVYKRATHADRSAIIPQAAPKELPHLPPAAANMDMRAVGTALVGKGTSAAKAVLKTMTKRSERVVGAGAPDLVFQIKHHLDAGTISPKVVAAHIKSVVGKYAGVTFGELVWRDYLSMAVHRAVGVTQASPRVNA